MIIENKNLYIERKGVRIPELPFVNIKETILGERYNLNVIFCTRSLSQKLNKDYRDKDYPTNILSFPLDDKNGEIYIQLSVARSDAKNHDMSYNKFIHLLYIHGCLHLLGYDHSDDMELLEAKYLNKYYKDQNEINRQADNSRDRHRD